jgi:glycosyltransferase involved in cell wall biosynthesis
MEKIISECSVGIVPLKSRVDFIKAIPNKAIEYLSYGIPILTSLSGDLQNFIDKNKVGLFYNNQSELKNHILRLKSDQHLLDELSNNASKIFLNKFDFSKNFESIKNHFISLIDKN